MSEKFTLYWIREDGQGDFNMGSFSSEKAAEAAIPAALDELLSNCGEKWQADEIKAGSFEVIKEED